ncbi:MAG: YitT family protein [Bacilli bacterium]|nr:YitT family protein [Bacilli bacterium]
MNRTAIKKQKTIKKIKEWIYITIGVALIAFSFSFFIEPKDIVIGGVSGIGVIIKVIKSGFNPAIIILVINIILLLIGLIMLGKDFFVKTAYGSLSYPLFIFIFEKIFTYFDLYKLLGDLDMFNIIVFSSIIMGIGIGIVVKYGGTTGGTEVVQKIIFKFFHIPFSYSLYFLDGIIIFLGIILKVQSLNYALYVLVFTFLSGAMIDLVVFSGFNKRAVYIISNKNDEIKRVILEDFERGLSSIKVIGEYSKTNREMLVCLLSTTEYIKLRSIIEAIDPTAFYFVVRASEVRGEGFSYD